MTQLEVTTTETAIVVQSQGFCGKFKNVGKNKKALLVFLRLFCSPETGKPLWTYQKIAEAFGYSARQNVENFLAEFRASGEDFEQFLTRKNTKHETLFPLIEAQVLDSPFLSVSQQYVVFCETYPNANLSESTFRQYVNEIEGSKLLKRVRQFLKTGKAEVDGRRYLQELLEVERLRSGKKKEIVDCFPEVAASPSLSQKAQPLSLGLPSTMKHLFVVLLYTCGLSQEMLALLLGVGSTSIHNWIYAICSEELDWQILGDIVRWSGRVSFDEKWIKIKGVWHFVLCAVDAETGFPLLLDVYPRCDAVSWTLFFKRFKAVYGLPKLILSDGSQALALARERVFSGVRYQLCKFHKLHNLMKRLWQHRDAPRLFKRCVRLAKHIFTNTSVSSRKAAAKRLQTLAGPDVSAYIEHHILEDWRQLSLSLTSNVSERFNRKIERCVSVRYGIPSEESAKVLLRGLWLKELLLHGQQHMQATSALRELDLSRMCQEQLDTDKILHFFHDCCPSYVEKYA